MWTTSEFESEIEPNIIELMPKMTSSYDMKSDFDIKV